jgi:hypothetical protein
MKSKAISTLTSIAAAFCGVIVLAGYASAQEAMQPVEVVYEHRHDTSLALRDMFPAVYHETASRPGVGASAAVQAAGTALTSSGGLVAITTVWNFDGISHTGWSSPDTNGAVGATQFVQWVNTQYAVYSKSTGAKVFGPAQGSSIFTGFGGLCETNNGGDVIAQYDKAAGRWLMTQRAVQPAGPFYQCVAVSATSDATGAWHRYAFVLTSNYPDYPKLGVWPDAYYITINRQNPTTFARIGGLVCALNRSAMLAGTSATAQCANLSSNAFSLLPSDLDGATPPPSGSPNYLLALGVGALNLWKFHVDWVIPANSNVTGPTGIKVANFQQGCKGGVCIPQPGTTQLLDSLGDRLMYRLAYRNFGSHESMVATHSYATGSGTVGIRWYEIQNPGGNPPTVYQTGNFTPDTTTYRWLGSMAMDKVGDIAVGYSVSGKSVNPGIRFAGRVPSDGLGNLEAESTIIAGTGVQNGSNSNWGDYSSMSIDPANDCTFWYTNEYYKTTGNGTWNTRIFAFKFPGCN